MMKQLITFSLLFLFCTLAWSAENITRDIIVYKSPLCGCCSGWVAHLRDNNFSVTEVNVDDVTPYKEKYSVPARIGSCHTAVIDGYVIEGHVPAADILTLLKDRPDILGLTVPGMPLGSPGMEVGDKFQPYDVLIMNKDGSDAVYNSYTEK
ncbi:MAG: hypothetical protein ACI9XC_001860 [Gammaproteobacteria bacterium]|jgi:hypothetical protein